MVKRIFIPAISAALFMLAFYACFKSDGTGISNEPNLELNQATDDRGGPPRNLSVPTYLQILQQKGRSGLLLPPIAPPEGNNTCMGTLTLNSVIPEGACYALDIYRSNVCIDTYQKFEDAYQAGQIQTVGLFKSAGVNYPNYTVLPLNTPTSIPISSNSKLWFVGAIFPPIGGGCSPELPELSDVINFTITNGGTGSQNFSVPDAFVLLINGLDPAVGPRRIICAGTPIEQIQECAPGPGHD